MKSELKENKKPDYPYLGINGSLVVLFISPNRGIAVSEGVVAVIGNYRENWIEKSFNPFQGQVILSN